MQRLRRRLFLNLVIILLLTSVLALAYDVHSTEARSGAWFCQNGSVYGPTKATVLVLVNETTYPGIVDELSIFERDLTFSGNNPVISTLRNGVTPLEVKAIIKSYYEEDNITGCILIGDIPAAYSEIRTGDYSNPNALRIWISLDAIDMYYMDLDGYWENVTNPDFYAHMPPNVAEVHLYPSCETFYNEYIVYLNETRKWDYSTIENKSQYKAEIWVSRIMGHNLAIAQKNEADIITDFLRWDHLFRTERTQIEDRVYLLNAIGSGYNDQNMNYSSIFNSITKKEYVTKSTYLECLENSNGSKLIYLTAHSWSQGHTLYDTNLTVEELANTNKTSVFYVLNACSACRWDQYITSPTNPNYLGGTYVFDKKRKEDHGLGTIGITGVGGFNWLEFLTDYLSIVPSGSYGEAYKYWFNENLMRIFGTTNYVYLGDPTIGPRTPRLTVHNSDTGLDYLTIQGAINAPETLDRHTIFVEAGTYYENVCVNKSVSIIGEDRERPHVKGSGKGSVFSLTENEVTIQGFSIGSATYGVYLSGSSKSHVRGNLVEDVQIGGIVLESSCSNSIEGNLLKGFPSIGIAIVWGSELNVIRINEVKGCHDYGIDLIADNNLVTENTMLNNSAAFYVAGVNNTIYHNNILANKMQVIGGGSNIWGNGCEGNYWSDYNGTDANRDGVGDTYLPWQDVDNYPLMSPFLEGDVNHDAIVDIYDIILPAFAYGSTPSDSNWNPHADLIQDNMIDIYDLLVVAVNFGKTWTPE